MYLIGNGPNMKEWDDLSTHTFPQGGLEQQRQRLPSPVVYI
jgi:hypothetical protein